MAKGRAFTANDRASLGLPVPGLAYDRIQLPDQFEDEDGRVHYTDATITLAKVSPYYGMEIPRYREMGLDPQRLYKLYRAPEELAKGLSTFNGLQLMDNHVHVNAKDPQKSKIAGTIGTRAAFDGRALKNDISVWDAESVRRIKDQTQREISASYYYDADMTPGQVDGEAYDGVMTNIRGNHVALVPEGRVGPEAALDRALQEKPMKKRTPAEALAYVAASGKIAADASPDALKKALDEAMEEDVADDEDETEAEKKAREDKEKADDAKKKTAADAAKKRKAKVARDAKSAKDKEDDEDDPAEDEDEDEDDKKEKASDAAVKQINLAVDAALKAERERNAAANAARVDVRPLVGEVVGMDSAEEIYTYALKEKGIAADGINLPGLKALVHSQVTAASPVQRPVAAVDSKSILAGIKPPRKL